VQLHVGDFVPHARKGPPSQASCRRLRLRKTQAGPDHLLHHHCIHCKLPKACCKQICVFRSITGSMFYFFCELRNCGRVVGVIALQRTYQRGVTQKSSQTQHRNFWPRLEFYTTLNLGIYYGPPPWSLRSCSFLL
jgi:hypothetical protein